jgi:CRP/FNR family cyclic AMP-dependent transcriptional regulator
MNRRDFDPKQFLTSIGEGRKIVRVRKKQTIYAQGDACDAVFYIQKGKVRLTVVSTNGREATIGILNPSVSSEKVAWPDSPCAWGLQPR